MYSLFFPLLQLVHDEFAVFTKSASSDFSLPIACLSCAQLYKLGLFFGSCCELFHQLEGGAWKLHKKLAITERSQVWLGLLLCLIDSEYFLWFQRDVCAFFHVVAAVPLGGSTWLFTTEWTERAEMKLILHWERTARVLSNPTTPWTPWTPQTWTRRLSFQSWGPSFTSGDGPCCSSSAPIPWATPSCGRSTAS